MQAMISKSHRDYTVNVLDRIEELSPSTVIRGDHSFTYSWEEGYERLEMGGPDRGSLSYAGCYHPNEGLCETETGDYQGICMWCGRTLL